MPPPTNTPGIYPRTRYQRLTGVPGLPTEPKGPRPPYGREPGPPRNPEFWLAVFFFFTQPSDIHGPATVWIPEHTPGPALHEAGTCAHPPRPQFSGPRIIANPTAPRPGNSVSMGHAHAASPINTPGIYPRTRYQRLTGVPGRRLPAEFKGPRPPYGREPGPPRNPRNFGCFFLFTHLSDIHRPATAWIPGRTPGPTLHGAGTCARPPRPRFSGPRTIIANLLVC